MKIRESIESNPIIYLLVTTISVAGFAVGIAEYSCRERIEVANQRSVLEISTLQSELASIKRGLGDAKYLDVRNFVYPKDRSPLSPINPRAQYVAGDGFYAMLNITGWNYGDMYPSEFNKKLFGKDLPLAWRKLLTHKMHVWSDANQTDVRSADEYHEVGPLITLQKTPIKELMSGIAENLPDVVREETGQEVTPDDKQTVKDIMPDLEKIYRGDGTEIQLASLISMHFEEFLGSSEISTRVVELQKVGNVVYIQFLTTLHNATVNGKVAPLFFVREEAVIITDQENVTVIHVVVPSGDPSPRGPVYTRIQEWFSGLAIPVG